MDYRTCRWRAIVLGAVALCAGHAAPTLAETDSIRVAQQFGIGYLPLQMMREHGLIEKHAAELGLEDVKTEWLQFSGGAAMNDALLPTTSTSPPAGLVRS